MSAAAGADDLIPTPKKLARSVGVDESVTLNWVYEKSDGTLASRSIPADGREDVIAHARRLAGRPQTAALGVAQKAFPVALPGESVTPLDTNDEYWDLLWGMDVLGMNEAWSRSLGEGAVVGVLDTGVRTDHPDLSGQTLPSQDFTGFGSADTCGHGTHVAGIVAAAGNNEIGVVGVAPKAKIVSMKVMGGPSCIGYTDDITAAVLWAIDQGNIDVLNLSLGATEEDAGLRRALQEAQAAGMVVVAAGGNYRTEGNPVTYPSGWPENLAVASADSAVDDSSFSNTGPHIDVTAPGGNIASTYKNGGYVYLSGTSMATPHVAGVVALMRSVLPDLTPSQIDAILTSTATDMLTPGRDDRTGWGMVSPESAILAAYAQQGVTPPPPVPWATYSPAPSLTPTPSQTPTQTPTPTDTPTESPTPTWTDPVPTWPEPEPPTPSQTPTPTDTPTWTDPVPTWPGPEPPTETPTSTPPPTPTTPPPSQTPPAPSPTDSEPPEDPHPLRWIGGQVTDASRVHTFTSGWVEFYASCTDYTANLPTARSTVNPIFDYYYEVQVPSNKQYWVRFVPDPAATGFSESWHNGAPTCETATPVTVTPESTIILLVAQYTPPTSPTPSDTPTPTDTSPPTPSDTPTPPDTPTPTETPTVTLTPTPTPTSPPAPTVTPTFAPLPTLSPPPGGPTTAGPTRIPPSVPNLPKVPTIPARHQSMVSVSAPRKAKKGTRVLVTISARYNGIPAGNAAVNLIINPKGARPASTNLTLALNSKGVGTVKYRVTKTTELAVALTESLTYHPSKDTHTIRVP